MAEPSNSPVALRQRREQTIARLCDHFARDHIQTEELEALIDRAHQATTVAELDELLAGLPSLNAPAPEAEAAHPARRDGGERQVVLAIMGGAERRGHWSPARQTYVTAVMGGVQLDFRETQLPPGVTEIYVVAIMGGVEITVAPGTCVESTGIGIMGGFTHVGEHHRPSDASTPVLRVSGLALMGGVDIREREIGERDWGGYRGHELHARRHELREARRRLRADLRRLRRGG
ncbi:MAG TPA: DUF1707 domain-containing protein [Longimicrobiaceae bacterium]|nr:DUF1707 domain-containing protein [Longimicrobiaceae bacterium]